ncbi:lipopolysaccharide biosynthesis protein [Flavitalea flava]
MEISISRVQKSLLNARINALFYFLALVLSYFSRKIFLQALGAQFVGFSGTVGNFLGFLNLAEMGTAMAVGFALYKPLMEKDQTRVIDIVALTGYLYRRIALIMTGAGILLSLFLPLIFPNPGFSMGVVYFAYYAFLIGPLLSYYLNCGQVLLDADQRNYVVTAWVQTTTFVKIITQLTCLSRFGGGYYSWIGIEFSFGILQSILLHRKIRKTYPFLKISMKRGKAALGKHPEITRSIKQLSVHKISEFALVSTKDLLIYLFSSLTMVAFYGNYVIVMTRLNYLLLAALTGLQAGIGNLIAEGNTQKTMAIFWEICAFRYFTTGVFIFSVYHLIDPFITLWLGREYLLDKSILLLMMCNVFFIQTRDIVINFVQGYGLFGDIGAPAIEAGLNIGLSIILGYHYGIQGVLMGSVISMFTIAFLWKPVYLFRRGFKQPVSLYWRELAKYITLLFISWWAGSRMILLLSSVDPYRRYSNWITYSLMIVTMYSMLLFVMMYPLKGMRQLVKRVVQKL